MTFIREQERERFGKFQRSEETFKKTRPSREEVIRLEFVERNKDSDRSWCGPERNQGP